jgi:hypothetical protein
MEFRGPQAVPLWDVLSPPSRMLFLSFWQYCGWQQGSTLPLSYITSPRAFLTLDLEPFHPKPDFLGIVCPHSFCPAFSPRPHQAAGQPLRRSLLVSDRTSAPASRGNWTLHLPLLLNGAGSPVPATPHTTRVLFCPSHS